jgi:hypothetical protein
MRRAHCLILLVQLFRTQEHRVSWLERLTILSSMHEDKIVEIEAVNVIHMPIREDKL